MSAVPPPYDRQASFTGFSTEQAPTLGQNLEAEFNKIEQSMDATQARLAEIQRDDGRLANNSVHLDSLSTAVKAILASTNGEVRGEWQTGLVYSQSDAVTGPDGVTYLASVDHVASASFNTDLLNGWWVVIDSGAAVGEQIRQDLASTSALLGAALVGYGAGTVKTRLDALGNLRVDLAATTAGLGAALLGWPTGFGVTQPQNAQHFAQNGATINRFGRAFFAAAGVNDGAFPNAVRDWMSDEWVTGGFGTGPMASAIAGLANTSNPNSAIGYLAAVRTKDFANASTTAIPVFGCAWNDSASLATKAYAGYFEAHRTAGAGADTYGIEVDTRTLKDSIAANPFQIGDVVGLQIASGAEWAGAGQFDASAAIQIAANPMQFKRGIVFGATAIDGTDGVTGVGEAISFARHHIMRWYAGSATPTSYINSTASTTANGVGIDLGANQLAINAAQNGSLQHAFVTNPSAVNYFAFYSAVAGAATRILAGGLDTNINISIEPKGSAGHVVIPIANLRSAANDAAAAALVPPVPVGGLYRNGSAVQIRAA